ncbi:MAG TPA: VanW family protein [Sporichthyaceae bacterium]|nr:VanW family protein [Sporichthyaceae bacterium]
MAEPTPLQHQRALRPGMVLTLSAGAPLVLLVGLYLLAVAMTGSKVPRGTEVFGVNIGGSSPAAAQAKLARDLPSILPAKFTVGADDKSFSMNAADLGLTPDTAATVTAARRGAHRPMTAYRSLFGLHRGVNPVLAVDTPKITEALSSLSENLHQDLVEGNLVFTDGVASAIQPVAGRVLDVPGTITAMEQAYRAGRHQVSAALSVTNPATSPDAVQRALVDFGVKAMSGPITVVVGPDSVEVTPQELGQHLSMAPDGNGGLKPMVDGGGLAADILAKTPDLGNKARSASFKIVDDKPEVVPSVAGAAIDPDKLSAEVITVLLGTGPRTVTAAVAQTQPKFTTADAEALGITEKMSTFKTYFPIAPYRLTNIGRAAKLINGSIVKPGGTWSLNKTVGERTAANGFVKGFIIKGDKFAEDLGGGVSQSATTTFNAVFFAGLQDLEHHPHSLYIGRYPAGREATVAWPDKDLRWKNDSGHGVYMQAIMKPGWISVTLWGTKFWDKVESISSPRRNIKNPDDPVTSNDPKCHPTDAVDGFDIDVTRVFYKDGAEAKRETFHTHYDPTVKVICEPPPTASPTPGATDSPAGGGGGGGGGEPDPAVTPDATAAPTPKD